MPAISVVIPVYKVEPYLRRCVDSVLGQTFSDIEVILVDDGSPDNCGAICDEYRQKDPRVIVIHQKNQGLSAARNAGIEIARGIYIGFVDSDDFVSLDMYHTLYVTAVQNKADIVVCGYVKTTEKCQREDVFDKVDSLQIERYTSRNALLQMLKEETFFVNAWDKLYRRELFDSIRYPIGKISEDLFTTYLLVERSKSIIYIPNKLYAYTIREGSILRSHYNIKRLDAMEALGEIVRHFSDADEELKHIIYRLYYEKALMHFYMICDIPISLYSLRCYRLWKSFITENKSVMLTVAAEKENLYQINSFINHGYSYYLKYKNRKLIEIIRKIGRK